MGLKHTPGPWTVSIDDGRTITGPDDEKIAFVCFRAKGLTSENAKLIAAAPELLAALIDTAEWIREKHGGDPAMSQFDKILPVITKAGGRVRG